MGNEESVCEELTRSRVFWGFLGYLVSLKLNCNEPSVQAHLQGLAKTLNEKKIVPLHNSLPFTINRIYGIPSVLLCKSRYWRLLSPCAAPAQCAKHFILKASRVKHLINAPVAPKSLFSLCDIPVVLKCLMQMTLKAFPMHSELTQLLPAACWCCTHCKISKRE